MVTETEGKRFREFAHRLKSLREAKGLGVRELSRRTGIHPSSISEMEAGTKVPTPAIMRQLVEAFDQGEMIQIEGARAMDALADERIKISFDTPLHVSIDPRDGIPSTMIGGTSDAAVGLHVVQDLVSGFAPPSGERREVQGFPKATANGAEFVVIVPGEGLPGCDYPPGTHMFVAPGSDAANGQPVVARLDGDRYLCWVYRNSGKRRWLEDRSGTIKDRIYLDQHDVEILGIVTATWWASPGKGDR